MKRFALLVLIVLCAISGTLFVGCTKSDTETSSVPAPEMPELSPEETVSAAMDTFVAGDYEGFAEYFVGNWDGQMSTETLAEAGDTSPETATALMKGWGESIEYKILSSVVKDDAASVEIEVSAVDYKKLLDSTQKKVLKEIDKNPTKYANLPDDEYAQKWSERQYELIIERVAKAKKAPSQTVSTTLIVDRSNGTPVWMINDYALEEVMFPGF